ncbi:hypothetical protein PSP6_130124 [Paraburkholderia tropica]|nr:hypothetical protein PSP6_130124 [Paraburkholderia tropica]
MAGACPSDRLARQCELFIGLPRRRFADLSAHQGFRAMRHAQDRAAAGAASLSFPSAPAAAVDIPGMERNQIGSAR